ncbi:CehA/McbA family metallohydrolase [Solimonas flava]|uniref:CehA/McbA family metallohydrolase n=1 Tax=Solimonas flava TaxID=415849 RepID=UPI0003F98C32|nr:CehA/McbA family metallohydrolase [Solimonas flava]
MKFGNFAAIAAAGAALGLLGACSSSSSGDSSGGVSDLRAGTWLSGDLHLHSDHSTDAADNPIAELIPEAESRGMGFFVITDHDNHVDGHITTWDDPAYHSDAMVMLYGVEYTTARGHANILGSQPFDDLPMYALRDRTDDAAGQAIADAAHAQNLHLSVNHPLNGDPWEFGFDMDIDSIEIWNAMYRFPTNNDNAVALWDSMLKSGRHLAARGGSDCHHQHTYEALVFNVGNPTTWVYASAPKAGAVLAALKAGNSSISYAPTAERVALAADTDHDGGYETLMGDDAAATGNPVDFRISIDNARTLAAYRITVIKNGETFLEKTVIGEDHLDFTDAPAAGTHSYYRVEVRGTTPEAPLTGQLLGFYGDVIAFTNPVYFGYD